MKLFAHLKYSFKTYQSDYQELGLRWMVKSITSDIFYPFKHFYRFIGKLFSYGRLLWIDFDFDWIYLLKIMKLKMTRMASAMDNGMTVSSPRHAKELRHAVAVIDRIIADDYDKLGYEKLEEKYGKTNWQFLPIENSNFSELLIEREKAKKGTPEYDEEYKETKKIMVNAERQRKADIKYLFEYITKHIEGWWD